MSIYKLSWNHDSAISRLKLFFSQKKNRKALRSKDAKERSAAYIALASTYITIAGSAFASFKAGLRSPIAFAKFVLSSPIWVPLGFWCRMRALDFAWKGVDLVGTEKASPEAIDILQSVLRSYRRFKSAKAYINDAFRYHSEITPHTKALLLIGKVDCALHLSDEHWLGESLTEEAYEIGKVVEKYDPQQAVRIYRNCSKLFGRLSYDCCNHKSYEDMHLCEKWAKLQVESAQLASKLAHTLDAKDQILKMGV